MSRVLLVLMFLSFTSCDYISRKMHLSLEIEQVVIDEAKENMKAEDALIEKERAEKK